MLIILQVVNALWGDILEANKKKNNIKAKLIELKDILHSAINIVDDIIASIEMSQKEPEIIEDILDEILDAARKIRLVKRSETVPEAGNTEETQEEIVTNRQERKEGKTSGDTQPAGKVEVAEQSQPDNIGIGSAEKGLIQNKDGILSSLGIDKIGERRFESNKESVMVSLVVTHSEDIDERKKRLLGILGEKEAQEIAQKVIENSHDRIEKEKGFNAESKLVLEAIKKILPSFEKGDLYKICDYLLWHKSEIENSGLNLQKFIHGLDIKFHRLLLILTVLSAREIIKIDRTQKPARIVDCNWETLEDLSRY